MRHRSHVMYGIWYLNTTKIELYEYIYIYIHIYIYIYCIYMYIYTIYTFNMILLPISSRCSISVWQSNDTITNVINNNIIPLHCVSCGLPNHQMVYNICCIPKSVTDFVVCFINLVKIETDSWWNKLVQTKWWNNNVFALLI